MPKAVIGLPISKLDEERYGFTQGWPASWTQHGFGPIKQVRWLGNGRYSKSEVRTYILPREGVNLALGIQTLNLVHVCDSDNFNFIIAFLDCDSSEVNLGNLLKVGSQANARLFSEKFGITLDGSAFVNGTCIINDGSELPSANNGSLHSTFKATDFFFDVSYGLGAAALTAERLLLEKATEASFRPGVLASKARRALTLTENWLSVPASDSTHILQELNLLRESLQLDQRMSQVRRSLKHQTTKVNQFLGYAISIPSLIATGIATVNSLNLGFFETGMALAGILTSFVVTVAVWQLIQTRKN